MANVNVTVYGPPLSEYYLWQATTQAMINENPTSTHGDTTAGQVGVSVVLTQPYNLFPETPRATQRPQDHDKTTYPNAP